MVSSDAADDPVVDMPVEDELIVDWACAPSASTPAPNRLSAVTFSEAPRSRNLNFFITFLHCAAPQQTACPADDYDSAPEFPDER